MILQICYVVCVNRRRIEVSRIRQEQSRPKEITVLQGRRTVTWSRLISACIRSAQGIYSFRIVKARYHPKRKVVGSNKMSNNSSLAERADEWPDTIAAPVIGAKRVSRYKRTRSRFLRHVELANSEHRLHCLPRRLVREVHSNSPCMLQGSLALISKSQRRRVFKSHRIPRIRISPEVRHIGITRTAHRTILVSLQGIEACSSMTLSLAIKEARWFITTGQRYNVSCYAMLVEAGCRCIDRSMKQKVCELICADADSVEIPIVVRSLFIGLQAVGTYESFWVKTARWSEEIAKPVRGGCDFKPSTTEAM
jgi:hypothetical protein